MKKLLSLLLAAVMALSLAVPAFADGPDGPPSLDVIGGADGPTGVITTVTSDDLFSMSQDELKESLGGVAGQMGVMVNGTYVKFPDAAPEATGGRTMVPVRALVETLGGEVDYRDGTVWFVIDGCQYVFVVGNSTVMVHESDGDAPTGTIEMDCAPYIKGNRTYVPIRFISEALGYDVGWDGAYQTAILLDREKLAADIDKNFSILNRVQAAANPALEEGKSWSVDVKGDLSVTAFDTVNGSQTYKADLTGKLLANTEAINGTCSVTISDNVIDALIELAEADENAELLRTVLTGLKDMEVIMNREGLAWFHAPLLDELSGTNNLWGAMDLGDGLGALMFSETNTATVGSALVSVAGGNSVEEIAVICGIADFMDRLYGDDKFTTSDGASTLTIGIDELIALCEDMGLDPDEVRDIWKECNITMKVDSMGRVTVTGVMVTAAQLGVPAIQITVDGAQNGQDATVTMKVHVANIGEMELTLTASQKTTGEAPRTEPPEDAVIVDIET